MVEHQLVQIDLKPKGAEGHLIPADIAASVDRVTINNSSGTFDCNMLAIGPLVAAKIKAHHNRETMDDYRDLMFVCQHLTYAERVREAAGKFRQEWKDCFLMKVLERDPGSEQQVLWAMHME